MTMCTYLIIICVDLKPNAMLWISVSVQTMAITPMQTHMHYTSINHYDNGIANWLSIDAHVLTMLYCGQLAANETSRITHSLLAACDIRMSML